MNILGFAIGEVSNVHPNDRPGKKWVWECGINSGFQETHTSNAKPTARCTWKVARVRHVADSRIERTSVDTSGRESPGLALKKFTYLGSLEG